MVKRVLVFILILPLLLFTSGCWDVIEPEQYAWNMWTGVDKIMDDKVHLIVALTPPLSPVPTGAAPPEKLLTVVSDTGDTLFDAFRKIYTHVSKRLFGYYGQGVFIGEAAARSGVYEYMGIWERAVKVRKNAWVFITRGSPDPVFNIHPTEIEMSPGKLIDSLAKNEKSFEGQSREIRAKDFIRELVEPGIDPVVSVVAIWDDDKKKVLAPGEPATKNCELILDGSAVFRGDKLVGWLSPEETQAFKIAKGELKGSFMVLPHPDNPQNLVGIEILGAKPKLKVKISGDKVTASLQIKVGGSLGDQRLQVPGSSATDPAGDPELYAKLGKELGKKIKVDVEQLIAKSQTEFDADILGIGFNLSNLNPKDWENVKSDWWERYKTVEIDVEVKAGMASLDITRFRLPREDEQEQSPSDSD